MTPRFEVFTFTRNTYQFFTLSGVFAWIERHGSVNHIVDLKFNTRIDPATGLTIE
jgi:hypothetical protein